MQTPCSLRLGLAVMMTLLAVAGCAFGQGMEGTARAPEFPPGFAWLNTDRPLRLHQELQGQVVLLDFWTYCCINCMHVLPDLDYLEHRFAGQPFLIVGVHSNKFDNEGQVANIRAAIQRYDIHHPVLVDEHQQTWNAYAINSWPTLVLVGADGRILGQVSGEGNRAVLEQAITRALATAKENGTLAKEPLPLQHEGMVRSASGLAFPARVVADVAAHRLLIVDSNHHRIVMTTWPDPQGHSTVLKVIGSGTAGSADGPAATAEFHRPQGLAVAGDLAYVADTENHLIRRLDLKSGTVTTILGTGSQVFDVQGGKSGRQQGLNSPWDVAVAGTKLYIAMAGEHQLWTLNLLTSMAQPIAGSGRENLQDGPAHNASLAQPSGLALDTPHHRLYFADSEVSAVRFLDLTTGEIRTILGHGLFAFGDLDGDAAHARLQHPLGLTLLGDQLLVADTYNHKIRLVDPDHRSAATFLGTGQPGTGTLSGALALYEPAGVSVGDGRVFIADTDNHRLVMVNPTTKAWREIVLEGLSGPPGESAANPPTEKPLDGGTVQVTPGKPVQLVLRPKLPPLTHLTPGAPVSISIKEGPRTLWQQTVNDATDLPVRLTLPAAAVGTGGEWLVEMDYAYCTTGNSAVCKPAAGKWKVTIKPGPGRNEIALEE